MKGLIALGPSRYTDVHMIPTGPWRHPIWLALKGVGRTYNQADIKPCSPLCFFGSYNSDYHASYIVPDSAVDPLLGYG